MRSCTNPVKIILLSVLAVFFNSSIKEFVSELPPAITNFLSVFTCLKASIKYFIPFSGTIRPKKKYIIIFFKPPFLLN